MEARRFNFPSSGPNRCWKMLRSAALVSRTGKLRWSTVVPRAPWKWRDLFHSRCGGEEEYCGSIPCHWMSLEIDPGTPIWTRGVTSSWLVRLKRPAQVGFHLQTHHFHPCLQSQDPGETKPCGGTKYRRDCWNLPNGTSRRWSLQCFKASRVGSRLPIFRGFQASKSSSTPWRRNGCQKHTSTGLGWINSVHLIQEGSTRISILQKHHQERQDRRLLLWLSRRWAECQHRLGCRLDVAPGGGRCQRWVMNSPFVTLNFAQEIFFDLENQTVGIAPAKCPMPQLLHMR